MFSMLLHNVMWSNNSTYRPTGNDAINEYVSYVADNYGNEAIAIVLMAIVTALCPLSSQSSVVAQVAKCSTIAYICSELQMPLTFS